MDLFDGLKSLSLGGWAVRSGDVGAAVPEPSVALLLASGLFGLMVTRRQRRR